VRIDIWSDVVCPWCYLGKRRLAKALGSLPWSDEVEIRRRAFQLDPTATRDPADLRAVLDRKYGPGAFDAMTRRLAALGAGEGIDYRFDRAQRVTSINAHRLLAWAWDSGGPADQDRLMERLFKAYFEEGANLADPASLARCAADVDLDPDDAERIVTTDAYADEVGDDLKRAAERDLTGVPSFVLEDRFVVVGAQDVETFRAVLVRARERL
jgi:predicted DsbA family dithiol-disulfide isomerase